MELVSVTAKMIRCIEQNFSRNLVPFLGSQRLGKSLGGITLAVLFVWSGVVHASYEQAVEAYNAGNIRVAHDTWLEQAQAGDPFSQYALGVLYHNGQLGAPDYEKAAHWFERAAKQDHLEAMHNLGIAYWEGRGVPQDYQRSYYWWRRGAVLDYPPAQFNLATMYYTGTGIDRDMALAVAWFRRAAQNGHEEAQSAVAVLKKEFPAPFAEDLATIETPPAAGTAGTTPAETSPVETAAVETTPVETTPAETTTVETTAVETTLMETAPLETQAETTPLDTASLETASEETESVETTSEEAGAAETTPVETAAAEAVQAETPVDRPQQTPESESTTTTTKLMDTEPEVAAVPDATATPAEIMETEPAMPSIEPMAGPVQVFAFPRDEAPTIGNTSAGSGLIIIEKIGGWARVLAPEGALVWAFGQYVEGDEGTARVTVAGLRARPLPSTGPRSIPVGGFQLGDTVEVVEIQGEWKRVRVKDRVAGWVRIEELEGETETASTQTMESATEPAQTIESATEPAQAIEPVAEPMQAMDSQSGLIEVFAFPEEGAPQIGRTEPKQALNNLLVRSGDWARVMSPEGVTVWAFGRYVDGDEGIARITTDGLRARPYPSTGPESTPIGRFKLGDQVEIVELRGDWKRVKVKERVAGWVRAEDIAVQ